MDRAFVGAGEHRCSLVAGGADKLFADGVGAAYGQNGACAMKPVAPTAAPFGAGRRPAVAVPAAAVGRAWPFVENDVSAPRGGRLFPAVGETAACERVGPVHLQPF